MNSDQLKYFELLYKEHSFSAAARRVPISPQALTKSIRALERELNVTLFEPDPQTGKPAPTAYAHEFYEFAAVHESNVRLLHEAFDRIRGRENATIRLGCCLGVMGAYGPNLLRDFSAAHPGTEVSYYESWDQWCENDFRAGTYDLALTILPATEGCVSQTLYRSPLYFWIRKDNPLANRALESGHLRIEDLDGCDIAIPGRGFKCHTQLLAVAGSHGVRLGTIFETSEIFRLYGYALDGLGLGFSNGTLVDLPAFTRDDAIVAVPCRDLSWGFAIERLETHALSDVEQQLWNHFAYAARGLPRNEIE